MSHSGSSALDDEASIEPSTSKKPSGKDYSVRYVVSFSEVSPDESFRCVAGTAEEDSPQPVMAANALATIPRAQAQRRHTVFVYGAMEQ